MECVVTGQVFHERAATGVEKVLNHVRTVQTHGHVEQRLKENKSPSSNLRVQQKKKMFYVRFCLKLPQNCVATIPIFFTIAIKY